MKIRALVVSILLAMGLMISTGTANAIPLCLSKVAACVGPQMRGQLLLHGIEKARDASNDLLWRVWKHVCFDGSAPGAPDVENFLRKPDFSAIQFAYQASVVYVGCRQ